MSKPIEIDLRRDLPKVREQLEAILPNMGKCRYSSPCAIGAMIDPRHRAPLDSPRDAYGDTLDSSEISTLLRHRIVSAPRGQETDLKRLQMAFDGGDADHFKRTLARLEAKYLTGEVG